MLENGARRVAIEIDDETSHTKTLVASHSFYDDRLKQNSMVHLGGGCLPLGSTSNANPAGGG